MNALGRHILADFYECDPGALNDPKVIERHMSAAAEASGATIVQSVFHQFSPHGVSGVVVVQESHLAIHTWPEYGYAAVDYFSCGPVNAEAAFRLLQERFGTEHVALKEISRGALGESGNGRPGVLAGSSRGAEEAISR